jgi:hypothetical protein
MHYRMVGRQRWRRRRTISRMRVTEEGYVVSENGGDEVNALIPVPETLGSAHQVILRPHKLHCTSLRIIPTSFRKLTPVGWWQKRNVRKNLFTSLQYPIESRWNDALGRNSSRHTLAWYSFKTSVIHCTMICHMKVNSQPNTKWRENRMSHRR